MRTYREELTTPVEIAQLATDLLNKADVKIHHDDITSVLRAMGRLGYSILFPETRR